MADPRDEGQKTEEPTQKRLADAREKGDGAKSQEVVTFVALSAATLAIAIFATSVARDLWNISRPFFATPEAIALGPEQALALARNLLLGIAQTLALPFLFLGAAGLAGHFLQQPPAFTASRLAPKLEKLSPLAGLKRLFGLQALITMIKNLLKLALIGGVAGAVFWPARGKISALIAADPVALLPAAKALAVQFLIAALAALALVAILDYVWQRFDFLRRQRMTKVEVRDEHRQMEGDPHVKAKIRQVRLDRARKRMMARVPEATVVITNPTHYAVALLYESGKMAAPVCVAKGLDSLAQRIKAVAEEHKVPLVENAPLARALYATVEVEGMIPPEHYKAVAGVIGYVMKLKGAIVPRRRFS